VSEEMEEKGQKSEAPGPVDTLRHGITSHT